MVNQATTCKRCGSDSVTVRFRLRDTHVNRCKRCGLHFLPDLDNLGTADVSELDDTLREYIAHELQSNLIRFPPKLDLIESAQPLDGARVMDIGAGGGIFLHLAQQRGASVDGIEPVQSRRQFAKEKYALDLREEAIETAVDPERDRGAFDVVTAWDVIEHVNDPFGFMETMATLTKPGGVVAFDTPARDGLLYRLAALEHDLTRGRSARLMRAMYSPMPFCHKQILSREHLRDAFLSRGFRDVRCELVTELSFPTHYYLVRIFRSKRLAGALDLIVKRLMPLIPLHNKVVGVFQRVE